MVRTAQVDLVGHILGDFEILERVSTGGMGTVYKAYQRGMQRVVAIKVLPPELAAKPVALERFYQEARSAARLDHPNIVRAITVGEQDGVHYFAMEYVEGESLARRLKRSGRLEEAEAVRVIAAVAEALEAAHERGIIHRDVKPENVLLTLDGTVKLADFGLVKRLDQDLGLTDAGKGLGTTNYMAPEQFKDAKHADVRCDIYGLGVTLHTALTATTPWQGLDPMTMYKRKLAGELPSVRQLNPSVSPRSESVIMRATRVDPAQRYANCGEFLSDLEAKPRTMQPMPMEELPTRGEFELPPQPAAQPAGRPSADVWFVRYLGETHRLRTGEVRQGVKSGRIARQMRISRSENGPWLPLSAFQEFVDLVAQISRKAEDVEMATDIQRTVDALRAGAPLRRRERNRTWLIWGGLIALAALALAVWFLNR